MNSVFSFNETWKKRLALVARFSTHQGILQFLNISIGFFLLRWLSYKEQALFSIAFGIQTTMGILSDMGFAGSIVSLTGGDIFNKSKIGAYIQSAIYFSRRFFVFITLFFACIIPFQFSKHDTGLIEILLITLPVMLSAFILVPNGFYQAPLLMHKQSARLYTPQIIMAILRLLIAYVAFEMKFISAVLVVWLIFFSFIVQYFFTKKYASPYVEIPVHADRNVRNEMWKFVAPYAPVLIFYAFQGQINIFIISFFGKTQNIAEVGALSRLNQLFVFVLAVHAAVVVPFIARAEAGTVLRKYNFILFAYFFFVIAVTGFTYLLPEPFLWIMGAKYNHLRIEVVWMMFAGAISFLGAAVMSMNYARKWIFWWCSIAYIAGLILIQFLYVWLADVSSALGILKMAALSNSFVVILYIIAAVTGYIQIKKPKLKTA